MASPETEIAVLKEQVRNLKEAIELQAREYERRLTELNHAAARDAADKLKFVPDAVYQIKLAEWEKWRSEIDKRLSRTVGIGIGASAGVGVVVSLIVQMLKQ